MKSRVLVLTGVLMLSAVAADALGDGRRFDTGASMTAPASRAPEEIVKLAHFVGQWDVVYETYIGDSLATRADGMSEVTYMNRGHAFMERFHCMDHDGQGTDLSTIAFIVYNKARQLWSQGIANSHSERIAVYSGGFEDGNLVLHNAQRRRGGVILTYYRRVTTHVDDDHVDVEQQESVDFGSSWNTTGQLRYTRRSPSEDFMPTASDYGEAAPGLPEEATQFDFLIGEWNNAHDLTFPNGRNVKFSTNATAVHVLDGHAIMEYSWFDADPNVPDAATTIVRIYNRQMRRWECMYSTNRFNSILYFGGVKEGERIVLHQFDADATDSPISQWIFHDMAADTYDWHANTSRDRGATWKKTWIIQAERK